MSISHSFSYMISKKCVGGGDYGMQTAANKITNYFLRIGLIEPYQSEWFTYILESRLTTLFSLPILILIGCFIAPIEVVITLNIGMLYLRPRINGFHSKTFIGCFMTSTLLELSSLFLFYYFDNVIAYLTFFCSIFIILYLGPFNNSQIHFTEEEMIIARNKMHVSLVIFCLVTFIILFTFPILGRCLIMSLNVVAFLLVIANLGFGIQ